MKAVITGGSGFVGSHLAEMLLEQKVNVICLGRGIADPSYLAGKNIPFEKADIMEDNSIEKHISKGDTVFHIAAVLGSARASAEQYNKFNVDGTVNVLEAAIRKKARAFVFVSSLAAMGPVGNLTLPMNEETPCVPDSPYGLSKLSAENKINEIAKGKITCIIVRPPIIYGARMNLGSGAGTLFKNMCKKTFIIIGNTENYFPVIHVKNLCHSMIHLSERHTSGIHIYIVTDGKPTKLKDFLLLIKNEFGINKRTIHLPYSLIYSIAWAFETAGRLFHFIPMLSRDIVRGAGTDYYNYDMAKAEKMGYEAMMLQHDAVHETAEWVKSMS
jgi:nucleoside-diphosphate-sugar epimerase